MNFTNETDFINDTSAFNETENDDSMALGPRICWDILFGSMIFVAVVGNLIVLWIVTGKFLWPGRNPRVSIWENGTTQFSKELLK